jgi:hypothetical protein
MNNPKHYFPILLVVLLLCGLGFANSDSEDLATKLRSLVPELGLVTFSEGIVEVHHVEAGWKPLYVGDRVTPEDAIRTAKDGRAEISWGNSRRVLRVERESFVALSGEAVGNRLVLVGARVTSGALWTKVQGKGDPSSCRHRLCAPPSNRRPSRFA